MSLVYGGKFDFQRMPYNPEQGCWQTTNCGHSEHWEGKNIDMPYNGIDPYRTQFKALAEANGAAAGGPILAEDNHYHLRFSY